jgi:exodeoxyribonuclease VII large subunit
MTSVKEREIFTVSDITKSIKGVLEKEYRYVHVVGEISNLSTPYSGHSYFTLKDSSSQLRAVLFKQQKRFVDQQLNNGLEVICFGRIAVYEPRGEYQLVVDSLEHYGMGRLQLEFDRLKRKLAGLGYFAASVKTELPPIPTKIAVISSPTGAAIRDFCSTVKAVPCNILVQLYPVRVQGNEAAGDIEKALIQADGAGYDLIVLIRGGGSLEDLWAFNDEQVAHAMHHASTPIITGIGHETDFTIADFCADLRCATPTAAAETIIRGSHQSRQRLRHCNQRLQRAIKAKIEIATASLTSQLRLLGSLRFQLHDGFHRLEMARSLFCQAMEQSLRQQETVLHSTRQKLIAQAPHHQVAMRSYQFGQVLIRLRKAMLAIMRQKETLLKTTALRVNGVSPLATLARGYAIARKPLNDRQEYEIVRNSKDIAPGEKVNILLAKGEFDCQVLTVREKN